MSIAPNPPLPKFLAGGAVVLAISAPVLGQENPFMRGGPAQPPPPVPSLTAAPPAASEAGASAGAGGAPAPLETLFKGRIPEAIAKGKFNLNARLRYEQDDEDGAPGITKNSYAPTLRTRFGYTTAPLAGFQGMLEGVNVSALGAEANYNAAGSNHQGARPAVGDPPLTRLDQAWVGYNYEHYFTGKAGEQRIVLDNQRFIGDVGWRQNMQTYDAASFGSEPVKDVNLYYSYLWDVHRVFGNVSGLPAANTDFDSRSHLINLSYSGWKFGRLAVYSYLLDLHNAAGDANSCANYGGYFAGAAPVSGRISLDYRAEFAWQTQYGESPLRYGAPYYNLEAGANIDPVAFGAGFENLGSGVNTGAGGGRASVQTPLATLHAFNGWADLFLTTPADGLHDLYGYVQWTLPKRIPVYFVCHKFDPDAGGGNYGQEFDALVTRKFGKHWSALAEFADYLGEDAAPPVLTAREVNIQKVWFAMEFNF